MDVTYLYKTTKKIKFYLVFFCLSWNLACEQGDALIIEQVDYQNKKAIGVTFTTAIPIDEIHVFVGEETTTSILGAITRLGDQYSFKPVVSFVSGQTYTFRKNNTEVLATFKISKQVSTRPAVLLGIYPKIDTVPENLLKMYFEFAQPMQEVGNALDFIKITNTTNGIETQPFLRLESELWNKERTLLTLWLDPGRIKTDLIPNRERGLPLTSGKKYTIVVDSSWKSSKGIALNKSYTKTFFVGLRDDVKPNIKEWKLRIPEKDSIKTLLVDFKEPMDAFLATETIHIYDLTEKEIIGSYQLLDNQRIVRFVPDNEWNYPEIEIRFESKLEDLAGNNLNRLFDTPIKGNTVAKDTSLYKSVRIRIRE